MKQNSNNTIYSYPVLCVENSTSVMQQNNTLHKCRNTLCSLCAIIQWRVLFCSVIYLFFLSVHNNCYAQEAGLLTVIQNNAPSELDDIVFEGNLFFNSSQLSETISLRPSNSSPGLTFFSRLRDESLKNPYAPKAFTDHLLKVVKSYQESEIRYYNPTTAEGDSATLLELYNQYGFHNAKIKYSFDKDTITRNNTLRFIIDEGKRSTIDTVVYLGLHRLPKDLQEKITQLRTVHHNDPFDEAKVKSDIDKVVGTLSNSGYYTVGYDSILPTVTQFSHRSADSITIHFVIGNRLKIGTITIENDLRGQPAVAGDLVMKMLEIQKGDLYSRNAIQNSLNNLLQLGLFERPSIDTVGLGKLGNDSTIPLRIFLPHRQARELSFSPFANRTVVDNFFNFGVEGSFLHRNFGGAAQSFNIFLRYFFQDFHIQIPGRFFSWLNSEIQGGINFSQPILFSIDRARIGASAQLIYSDRDVRMVLSDEFTSPAMRLRSASLRLAFPIQLPKHTFFNAGYFDIFTDASSISGYQEATEALGTQLGEALSASIDNEERTNQILALLSRYSSEQIPFIFINNIEDKRIPLTAFILGTGISGDDRDNIFSPTKGYLATLSAEFALSSIFGIDISSTFTRLQFLWTTYSTIGKEKVFATKVRAGHIFLSDPQNDYVPFERHFFAGGSNSVRAYPARALYDPVSAFTGDNSENANLSIIGNRTIIEGSFELRWGFGKPSWTNDFIGEQIDRSGIGFFLDWGNAYNRFYTDDTVGVSLSSLLKGIAVGIGTGYRFETPVGPFRVDFAIPLYDPLSPDREFITSRAPFDEIQIHIALGHAF